MYAYERRHRVSWTLSISSVSSSSYSSVSDLPGMGDPARGSKPGGCEMPCWLRTFSNTLRSFLLAPSADTPMPSSAPSSIMIMSRQLLRSKFVVYLCKRRLRSQDGMSARSDMSIGSSGFVPQPGTIKFALFCDPLTPRSDGRGDLRFPNELPFMPP